MDLEAFLGMSYAVAGLLFVASYYHYRGKLSDLDRSLHGEETFIHVWFCCLASSAYAIAMMLR